MLYLSVMKNIFTLLTEKNNRKLGMSFALFFLFIVVSLVSLFRGISDHDTERILIASAGFLGCAALCYLIVYTVVKNSKKIVAVKPNKRRK